MPIRDGSIEFKVPNPGITPAPTADELYRRADEAHEREEKAREKAEAKAVQRATAIRTLTSVAEGSTPRHGDPMAAVEAARTLLEIS